MKKLLLGVLLVLAGMAANAERMDDRWVHFGSDPNGGIAFYDSQTMGNNQIWIWTRYARQNQQFSINNKQYDERKVLYVADCATRRLADISGVLYLRGKVVDSGTAYPEYEPVVPGSYGEAVYGLICQAPEW